jgi:hypothetical protein
MVYIMLMSSCIKEECKFDYSDYVFEIPSSFSPKKDTFNIGDTITISSKFSDVVYDRSTQQEYSLIDFKFYPDFRITKISLDEADRAAFIRFDVLLNPDYPLDHFYGPVSKEMHYYGQYQYNNSSYELEFKFVAQDTGLFVFQHFTFINSSSNNGQEQEFPGKCKKTGLDIFVNSNNNEDNNIDFLTNSPDEHYNTWILIKPTERFYKSGCFAFYVK